MKNIIASAAIILASLAYAPASDASDRVPLNVVYVSPLGDHQLVVYSACSPEHCWQNFYIRKIVQSPQDKVACRKPIAELNAATDFVLESVTAAKGTLGQLELHMASSHSVFLPAVVTLKASGLCQYQVGKLPAAAANNSFKPNPLRGSA